ncbi:uncharacterized protein LOC125507626 [Triticum urartu]|uniref:uncharacterized protein LOC125507626 n=1 Tax=Triticum urartu TaxID=4572 RepID=UPI0020438641|nr:uncharacterized protein LOC125507626 [Triticum urartu]
MRIEEASSVSMGSSSSVSDSSCDKEGFQCEKEIEVAVTAKEEEREELGEGAAPASSVAGGGKPLGRWRRAACGGGARADCGGALEVETGEVVLPLPTTAAVTHDSYYPATSPKRHAANSSSLTTVTRCRIARPNTATALLPLQKSNIHGDQLGEHGVLQLISASDRGCRRYDGASRAPVAAALEHRRHCDDDCDGHGGCNSSAALELCRCRDDDRDGPAMALQLRRCNGASPSCCPHPVDFAAPALRWSFASAATTASDAAMKLRQSSNEASRVRQ